MHLRRVSGYGVNDRERSYLLRTNDGSIIRFSNDGVDGSGFVGWPDYSFDDYKLSVTYEHGTVNFEAVQGNHRIIIPLGKATWCDQLKRWLHAVNARLPQT